MGPPSARTYVCFVSRPTEVRAVYHLSETNATWLAGRTQSSEDESSGPSRIQKQILHASAADKQQIQDTPVVPLHDMVTTSRPKISYLSEHCSASKRGLCDRTYYKQVGVIPFVNHCGFIGNLFTGGHHVPNFELGV